jgi:hypothetical protein
VDGSTLISSENGSSKVSSADQTKSNLPIRDDSPWMESIREKLNAKKSNPQVRSVSFVFLIEIEEAKKSLPSRR